MSDDRDDRLAELLGTLREDVRAPAELRDAVMRRIEHRSAFARFAEWALRPRMVPMSPALGALAAEEMSPGTRKSSASIRSGGAARLTRQPPSPSPSVTVAPTPRSMRSV